MRRSVRQWGADLGFTGLGALLGCLLLAGELSDPSEPGRPLSVRLTWEVIGGGPSALVFLLLRRRWPVGTALPLILVAPITSLGLGMGAAAAFNVAVRRSWPATAGVAAMIVVVIATVFRTAPAEQYWEGLAVILLLNAVMIVSGMLVRSQRQLVGSLRERARQAEEGQRLRVEEARHLERERLAREMHDVLAHRISLLAVHAGALEYRQDAPADERRAAGVIRQCAYEAMEDLREVLGMLRQDTGGTAPQPALTDLPRLVEESRDAGADVDLRDRLEGAPPERIGRHVYRIVQEGLTNARKHAPGAPVRVTLGGDPAAGITVEVRNPPPPHPPPPVPGAGAGLIGLRERVELLGGRLEHGPAAGEGHLLRAWLPWAR